MALSRLLAKAMPGLQRLPARAKATFAPTTGEVASEITSYATSMQWTHWTMAGGILSCFGLAYAAPYVGPEPRAFMMKWHSQIGMLVLGGVGLRVGLRLRHPVPPHLPGPMWEHIMAKAAHTAMYPMMAMIPLTGVAMAWYTQLGRFRVSCQRSMCLVRR